MDVQQRLRSRLAPLLKDKESVLARGKAKDWADYQKLVGEIAGLQRALDEIDEVSKEIAREQD